MIRYVFKDDEPVRIKAAKRANPQAIGEALAAIADQNNKELRPLDVVNAARNPANPLHPHFEWDDHKAAEAYRLDQARNIIRIIRVEDPDTESGTARAYYSINGPTGTAYKAHAEVKNSIDFQKAILDAAERELQAFQLRYKDLIDVCALVGEAKEAVVARRTRHENRPTA